MARLSSVLLFLLLAAPVQAQEPRLKLALGSYLTAAFTDTSITSYCTGKGTCHEVNPLLKPIVERHNIVAAMTVKGAMHAGIAAWLLKAHKEHPKRVFWITVGLTAAQIAVDVQNVRTLRK